MKNIKKNYRWFVLANVAVGTFMATLDGGIVNVGLPEIAKSLKTDLPILQWVVTSYLLTISSLLPIFGRLADIIGRRKVYSTGFLVFSLGSLLCALSTSVAFLIGSRVIQAIGASMLMSNGPGLITSVFPGQGRGRALGMLGTVVALGSMTGPVVGGVLISAFGWPFIFLVNLPIGIIGFLVTLYIIKKDPISDKKESFDSKGAIFFALGMLMLLLGLSQIENWGLTSPLIITLILAVIFLTIFVRTEIRVPEPMIDLSLFKNRAFFFGNLAGWISFISMFSVMILMPFFLDQILHFTPKQIGLLMTPFPLAMAVVSPLSGNLSDRIGPVFLTTLGLAVKTVGLLSMLWLSESSSFWDIAIRMFFIGFGAGLFQSPNNSSVMGAVPQNKLGVAGGINSLVRNIGMVMGIALAVSLFTTRLKTASFLDALDFVFLWAAGISALGVIISAIRPRPSTDPIEPKQNQ